MRFPVQLELRIDWSEMDLFGHVNNLAFMKYIQASRVNYWEKIKLTDLFEETKTGPMLASTSCTFLKPLHYPGNIIVQVRLEFTKNTSFGLHHQILDETGEVAAEGHDVVVVYDFINKQKASIPGHIRENIGRLEKE
jgi:acyl-CoA thioester hydrolase